MPTRIATPIPRGLFLFCSLLLCAAALPAQVSELRWFQSAERYWANFDTINGDSEAYVQHHFYVQDHLYQGNHVANTREIPVIFHVIDDSSPGSSPSKAITPELVQEQLDALNEHFAGEAPVCSVCPDNVIEQYDVHQRDSGFRFCFFEPEPGNTEVASINYYQRDLSTMGLEYDDHELVANGLSAYLPNQVVNVWIADLELNSAGYAQFPLTGPAETDGIVINRRYFGLGPTPGDRYNEGKTLTTLMGSYLGLYPLRGLLQCWDDYVADTPPNHAQHFGVPSGGLVTTCIPGPNLPMFTSFMDSCDDPVRYLFSAGQISRMYVIARGEGARAGLGYGDFGCGEQIDSGNPTAVRPANAERALGKVHVSPNPADDQLFVDWQLYRPATTPLTLRLYNVEGRVVWQRVYSNARQQQRERLSVAELPAGLYRLHLSGGGAATTRSFVVAH